MASSEQHRKKYVQDFDWHRSNRQARLLRVAAKMIDFTIAMVITIFFYPYGVLLGASLLAILDAAHEGESIGKKLLGLRVLHLEDRTPCQFKASILRNLPFTIPWLFLIIPFWGWFIFIILFIPACILEFYYVSRLDSFHRLGDVLADTTVVADDPHHRLFQKMKKTWAPPSPL